MIINLRLSILCVSVTCLLVGCGGVRDLAACADASGVLWGFDRSGMML